MWSSTRGSCITCMWMGRKSCFHTKKCIVFRNIRHKIQPDKSFTMALFIRNIPVWFLFVFFSFSINSIHPAQCRHLSLSHFSGQSAQTAPWVFRFADFRNLSLPHLKLLARTYHKTSFRLKVKPHNQVTTDEDNPHEYYSTLLH